MGRALRFPHEIGGMTSQTGKAITVLLGPVLGEESMRAALEAVSETCFLASTQGIHMSTEIQMVELGPLPTMCCPLRNPQKP